MKVYIGASKGISFTSRIIRWWQWGYPYTHIFYIFRDQDYPDPFVLEAWWNGVKENRFSEAHTPGTKFSVYSITVTEDQKYNIENFLINQIGKSYDWLGILGFPFRSTCLQRKARWFCSELVFSAFIEAGIVLLRDTKPAEVSPRLFLKSPLLKHEHDLTFEKISN